MDIIDSVQALLHEEEEEIDGDDEPSMLEPTPIGPFGFDVVKDIPLTHHKLHEKQGFDDLLLPLLDDGHDDDLQRKNKRNFEEHQFCFDNFFKQDNNDDGYDDDDDDIKEQEVPEPAFKKQCISSTAATTTTTTSDSKKSTRSTITGGKEVRIRTYQLQQWDVRFNELQNFHDTHGHCMVPHNWKDNLPLAKWVKRQRYQYNLKKQGKRSTMTQDRIAALNKLGFIWDSHGVAWEERLNELRAFQKEFGHCNVPSNYSGNRQLSIWVKCQRRQYKLYISGDHSNMTVERIAKLDRLGFVWIPRS